jgi:hypothetical protein
MLRAGMGMDLEVIKKKFGFMCVIGWVPAIGEAFAVAAFAMGIFNMNFVRWTHIYIYIRMVVATFLILKRGYVCVD